MVFKDAELINGIKNLAILKLFSRSKKNLIFT